MPNVNYFYLSALPFPGDLGAAPPLSFGELMQLLDDQPDLRNLVASIVLLDDLTQREGYLAGELKQVEPAVLTVEQARNESPLPDYLEPSADSVERAIGADLLWESYFRHVARIAHQRGNEFLRAWVGFEVALRNALASARAAVLGLDETDYLVAPDLAESDENLAGVVAAWSSAATPLVGQLQLIRARWAWLVRHDGWFTFRDDELAAYAVRLLLLHQWRRVAGDEESAAGSGEF
jgi:hypothetical protein